MIKHLTVLAAFLMVACSQVSAQAICDTVRGRLAIVTDQAAAKDSLIAIEQQLSSGDFTERTGAQISKSNYEQQHGYGSFNALITNSYEEWLAEQDCGTVDELRPQGAHFDKQILIDLCLRHFPEVTIGKSDENKKLILKMKKVINV